LSGGRHPDTMDAEGRKLAAVEFLRLAAAGQVETASRLLHPGGRHHNPWFPAGWAALLAAMGEAAAQNPGTRLEVQRTLADGDLVAVHSRVEHGGGKPAIAVVHLFRFEEGRIAELWDVGQALPADTPNRDGAF
jgi:predicted SnoaL-like aldol condensation-catalyzing enzyme